MLAINALGNVLLRTPASEIERWMRRLILLIFFLAGAAFWFYFFGYGRQSLVAYDWVKETAYLNTLRQALSAGVIPWQWSGEFYHVGQEFLANPEVVMTPDVLLLPWLSNEYFVIFHVILFYSAGFVGLLQIVEEFELSLVAQLLFWALFNFNGYVTAHLAVGHFQWAGYLLLPIFFLVLYRLIDETRRGQPLRGSSPPMALGLLLGTLLLNGSFHLVAWMAFFMIFSLLWQRSLFKGILVSLLAAATMGAARIVPTALYFPPKQPFNFISGYPDLGTLLDALTVLRDHNFARLGSTLGRRAGWWEYDAYIGITALVVVTICCVVALRSNPREAHPAVLGPAVLFLVLSLGNIYMFVADAPIPFANIERVSARFIAIPLVVSLILAMRGLDELIRRYPRHGPTFAMLGLPLVLVELRHHAQLWNARRLAHDFDPVIPPGLAPQAAPDRAFELIVGASWTITLVATVLMVGLLVAKRKAAGRTVYDRPSER